jgi:transposase
MIQVTPNMKVLVAREPLDFRSGIDGTAAVCRRVLRENPLGGKLFVFRNRSRTMIRLLIYDGHGMWLMTKRVSSGRFRFWLDADDEATCGLDPHQLHVLLAGADWTRTSPTAYWQKAA